MTVNNARINGSMSRADKYARQYFMPPEPSTSWVQKEYITQAPVWCSVDLRDGNQALVVPMNLDEKLEYFKLLLEIGFKEIEVGFPAASETEYAFLRRLIDENLIPDDVTVQVLTQAREHIIQKTFEALQGVKKAIVHLYNPTSVAQREQVFRSSKQDIIDIAVNGAKLFKRFSAQTRGDFQFQYSPESFTGTEVDFAVDVCNQVLDVWQPTVENPVIINLPATVSLSMPHIYASQIEYVSQHLNYRENVILSLHPHNDRGTGVADAELGMLAGGQRVEGTLFGNGERTGNVDLVTLALNLFSHGVDPKLNLDNIPELLAEHERLTKMEVGRRHPYGGELVFTAFSGSHQDAIAKGMKWRDEAERAYWSVPYLLIDPRDIGREYEGDIIRINSQSGKGGIGYVLEQHYGLVLPPKMREAVGYSVKNVSDRLQKELLPNEIYEIFMKEYANIRHPIEFVNFYFTQQEDFKTVVTIRIAEEIKDLTGAGNGRLDAISNALRDNLNIDYADLVYSEHALEIGSRSQAISYIGITASDGAMYWACGVDSDIMTSSVKALFSAVNKLVQARNLLSLRDNAVNVTQV